MEGHYEYDLKNHKEILVRYRPDELRAGIKSLRDNGHITHDEMTTMLATVLPACKHTYDTHKLMMQVAWLLPCLTVTLCRS